MEPLTVDKRNSEGYKVRIRVQTDEAFDGENSDLSGLCLVFFREGSGIIRLGEDRIIFTAPSVLCIKEEETKVLECSSGMKASSVYFLPSYINSLLNFENIRNSSMIPSDTATQDADLLRPFTERPKGYRGYISLDLGLAARIADLYGKASHELLEQPDCFWPCRSRSYFLELIFLVYRLYLNPDSYSDTVVLKQASEMDQIILHLNMNYMNKITLSDLENIFHKNRTSLNEKFHEATGSTIKQYLIRLRIRMACMMLRDTMLPVEEVMFRTGYSDTTNFGRSFRRLVRVSPSEYRDSFNRLVV